MILVTPMSWVFFKAELDINMKKTYAKFFSIQTEKLPNQKPTRKFKTSYF